MSPSIPWQQLGRVAPGDLSDARIQAHWAAQLLAAAADSHADRAPDDSHSNLGWHDSLRALVGRSLAKAGGAYVGLRVDDLTVLLLDDACDLLREIPLAGRTLAAAREELSRELASRRGGDRPELVLRDYEMPSHPVAQGGCFDLSHATAFAELGGWVADAAGELGSLAERTHHASQVRCWPHHFDTATLITLDGADADGNAKKVGVGMTPGDGSYAEPYWYVTPYPYPDAPGLRPLTSGGRWHREGWLGAVLVGEVALEGTVGAEAQRDRVRSFLADAIEACREMLAS